MNKTEAHQRKLTAGETIWVIGLFFLFFFLSMQKEFNYAPDELMRYQIPEYIFRHNALPNGNMEELRNEIWGFSYAYYPFFLGPLLSAGFMKIVSVFTVDPFALVVAARFTSVLSGVAVTYFAIKIAKELFDKNTKWIFITFTTLIPQFIFLTTYVNNDVIAVAGSAMIVYAWILGIRERWEWKSCVLLAVGIGVCALSYYNSYGWILCSIFVFFASELWQRRKKISDKELWKWGICISVIVVAMISYFFIRNAMLYDGDFLGMRSLTEASEMYARGDIKPSNRPTPMNLGMGLGEMLNTTQYMGKTWANATFQSFVAVFGYMDVYAPDWVYNVYKIVLLLGVIGIIIRLVQRLKNDRTKQIKEQVIFHVNMLICMVIPVGLSIYYSYATDYQPQGRYCYPMLLALTYFVAKGMESLVKLLPSEKAQMMLCRTMSALFGALTGYVYLSMYMFWL